MNKQIQKELDILNESLKRLNEMGLNIFEDMSWYYAIDHFYYDEEYNRVEANMVFKDI